MMWFKHGMRHVASRLTLEHGCGVSASKICPSASPLAVATSLSQPMIVLKCHSWIRLTWSRRCTEHGWIWTQVRCLQGQVVPLSVLDLWGDVRSLHRGKGTGPCSHALSPSEQALTVQAQQKRCNGNCKLQWGSCDAQHAWGKTAPTEMETKVFYHFCDLELLSSVFLYFFVSSLEKEKLFFVFSLLFACPKREVMVRRT